MTTDITELAQSLVGKAKLSSFFLEYISQFQSEDIDSDDVDLRFEVDGVDTGTTASIVNECGKVAAIIDELVEALEKAQSAKRTLESLGYTDNGGELWKPPIGPKPNFSLMDSYRHRIAELESRTVTVKLPHQTDFDDPLSAYLAIERTCRAFSDAGIRWEVDG